MSYQNIINNIIGSLKQKEQYLMNIFSDGLKKEQEQKSKFNNFNKYEQIFFMMFQDLIDSNCQSNYRYLILKSVSLKQN
ncbi:hypothetical protein pb186bvf_007878 [Paramecium bursaria]